MVRSGRSGSVGAGAGGGGTTSPQAAELLAACTRIKTAHPDFGVKRVFNALLADEPTWRLTERRVQRVMRAEGMTGAPTPPPPPIIAPVVEEAVIAPPVPRNASFSEGPPPDAPRVFPEDCVSSVRKPAQYGWVLRAAGVLGGDDEDFYEDEEEEEARHREVPAGMARVQWLDKYEPSLETLESLKCVDRPFVAGDVVARASDPVGSLGTVMKVELKAQLRIVHHGVSTPVTAPPTRAVAPAKKPTRQRGAVTRARPAVEPVEATEEPEEEEAPAQPQRGRNKSKKKNVSLYELEASRLRAVAVLRMGDAVVHKSRGRWVGRVVGATYDVTVHTPTGAVCVVKGVGDNGATQAASNALEPLDDVDYGFDELCPFFPGQRVSAAPSVWRRATWKSGRAPPGRRRRHGTVDHVEVAQAAVQWLAWGVGASREPPPMWSDMADLDLLRAFAGMMRVGDHVCETTNEGDDNIVKGAVLPRRACAQVVRTSTKCLVRWSSTDLKQAASEELLDSLKLVPRQHLGEHDFLPNDFVVRRHADPDDPTPEEAVGVVRCVDARRRTCVVRWMDDEKEETLSAYEVALHATHNYSAGDLVLRLSRGVATSASLKKKINVITHDTAGAVAVVSLTEDVETEHEATELAEAIRLSLMDQGERETFVLEEQPADDVAERWVGQVVALLEGKVKVLWHNGATELMPPRSLLVVPDARAAEEAAQAYSEDNDDEFQDVDDDDDESEDDDLVNAVAESMKASPVATPQPLEEEDDEEEEEPVLLLDEDSEDGGSAGFAVLEGAAPLDHSYASSPPNKVALPKIRRLWSQLSNGSLPSGVTVRAFQERSDLLRCLLVGPADTPYADLLFVFDIQLSATYPKEPPTVHYHAQNVNERLNPNLYESGKVCLSLLGTWSGPGWDAETSTVLQLLVSIQGLVLVDKPYYNEPGNEKHANTVEGEQQARLYNENATLLSIQATTAIAKRPPAGLKSAIDSHFAKRRESLLAKLEATAEAVEDGDCLYSDGFRRVLRRILPHFKKAISR